MKSARTDDRRCQRDSKRNGGIGAKNRRANGSLQDQIPRHPHRPRHCAAECPPLLRPRRKRPCGHARERTAYERQKPRLYLRQQFAVHRKRSQPAQQQRESDARQTARCRAREKRQPFLFRMQKNTPCRTYASQHIPAGDESFRKRLYTSGPFGSSCFGSSFFASFAFCLAALRSCASLAACASARAFVEMAHLAT